MTFRTFRSAALLAIVALYMTAPAVRADEKDKPDDEPKIWSVDFEASKKAAAEKGKDILMEFTGSDWCPPCKALHANVLVKDVFKTKTPESFVLVKLDNPRDKSNQTEAEIEQYKELSAKYKITGVPTVILADAEGRPYAKLVGYGGTEAEEYVNNLIEKTKVREQRDEMFAKAKDASGIERAKLLDEALGLMDADMAVSIYGDTVDEIMTLDADNEAGLKDKYEGKLLVLKVNDELLRIRRELDPENVQASVDAIDKLLDELQSSMKPVGEVLQQVYFTKGSLLFANDKEASKAALEMAMKVAPETEMAGRIETILKTNFQEADDDGDDDDDNDGDDDDN